MGVRRKRQFAEFGGSRGRAGGVSGGRSAAGERECVRQTSVENCKASDTVEWNVGIVRYLNDTGSAGFCGGGESDGGAAICGFC